MHALAPQMCPEDILVDTHVMLYLKPHGQKVSMCLKMIPAKQKHIWSYTKILMCYTLLIQHDARIPILWWYNEITGTLP